MSTEGGSAAGSRADPPPAETPTDAPPRVPAIAKGLAFVLVGLATLHLSYVVLWNMPSNAVRQELWPTVSSYMRPYFAQNWRLFAPNIVTTNRNIQVRAVIVDDDDEAVVTPWFDITAYETRHVRHNPAPSKARRISTTFYSTIASARSGLNSAQRDVIDGDYSDGDWERLAADLATADPSSSAGSIASYIRNERMLASFASGVARAVWGSDVRAVQVRLQSELIPRFPDRHDDNAESSFSYSTFGWRPTWRMVNHDQSVFDDFFADAAADR